ncbi:ERV/ALR sulfhydryl oxidase domain-containing protein [Pelagophyceae sp. CCMP2097]|nr:ERV/ALR sulfhydryl oxidase domain-containing protein [Pelagophyceae sp. CCMP2097]
MAEGSMEGLKKDCFNPACNSKMSMFTASVNKLGQEVECPLFREELGRSTWGLLHTTAAYYPDEPTPADKTAAAGLISGLAALYPCAHCAEDFRATTKADPPKLGSRVEFALWLCNQHNTVNLKLGKPTFKCSSKKLDRRWLDGGKDCWQDDGSASESLGKAPDAA